MNVKKHPIDHYKRFLLNRATSTTSFVEFIENILAAEDEAVNYCFHKIMIHNWTHGYECLFDTMAKYFTSALVPVNVTTQGDITTFYTSNLNLILRIMRMEFLFSSQRNMFNVDVLFNDKTAVDFFDHNITLDYVVSSVVSRRFNDNQVLDLSNFCDEQEFKDKMIYFYKLSLLANFKILMIRIGRDTKSLNLSYNNLSQPPLEIMNFFIKGDLTEINLSYNKINSISDLVRVSSKIEKLWVEGNPLCDDNEPSMYVKHITMKFPRLTELDGITLNEFGLGFPFNRNFLSDPTRSTKMVVEKFLTLYFSNYDQVSRRSKLKGFYDLHDSVLTLTCGCPHAAATLIQYVHSHSRNFVRLNPSVPHNVTNKIYKGRNTVLTVLSQLPNTMHDPTSFTVDVLRHDKKCLFLVVDGVFKDLSIEENHLNLFRFRRTFMFNMSKVNQNTVYTIQNEMFHIDTPTREQKDHCFKQPMRNMNSLELINPHREETETVVNIFSHITQLKKDVAETRLRVVNWDLKRGLRMFLSDVNHNKVAMDQFMEEDDFSDSSSLIDDEMVD